MHVLINSTLQCHNNWPVSQANVSRPVWVGWGTYAEMGLGSRRRMGRDGIYTRGGHGVYVYPRVTVYRQHVTPQLLCNPTDTGSVLVCNVQRHVSTMHKPNRYNSTYKKQQQQINA